VISYAQVRHIAYALIDHGSLLGDERGHAEIFDVALTLTTGEEVPLCRFSGDGEFVADVSLPHEWIGDRVRETLDVHGNQQEKSLDFVDILSARIGAPIGPSKHF
jgi:3-deoxy-D-arabino-heptulosonate 7-phosphate (DAHP) synthase class II